MDLFREALDACARHQFEAWSLNRLPNNTVLVTGDREAGRRIFGGLLGFVSEIGGDGLANVHVPDGHVRFVVRLPGEGLKAGEVVRIPTVRQVVPAFPVERVIA